MSAPIIRRICAAATFARRSVSPRLVIAFVVVATVCGCATDDSSDAMAVPAAAAMTGADHRHAQLLPERDPSGGGAGTASAGLRLPSSSFEGYLIDQIESGFFTAKQAKDVLAARERLGARLNDIPPDFSGYAAATVDGQLYTTTDLSIAAVLEWLDHHNPPGRFGYFTWVQAAKP